MNPDPPQDLPQTVNVAAMHGVVGPVAAVDLVRDRDRPVGRHVRHIRW